LALLLGHPVSQFLLPLNKWRVYYKIKSCVVIGTPYISVLTALLMAVGRNICLRLRKYLLPAAVLDFFGIACWIYL